MLAERHQFELVSTLARSCASRGHDSCRNPDACELLLSSVSTADDLVAAALQYDVAIPYNDHGGSEPNATWPVAALLRCVSTHIVQPPWREGAFRRSVWVTGALARLGEKGLSADAVLRTCVGPSLKQRILILVATAWHSARLRNLPNSIHPHNLYHWVQRFEDVNSLKCSSPDMCPSLEELIMMATTGEFEAVFDDWLSKTAAAHIVDWRLQDALIVEVLPSDVVLPGGATATRWVFDRFSETYLDDWAPESLSWELSFTKAPERTALRAGFDALLLEERPTATSLVIDATIRLHSGERPVSSSSDFGGVDAGEIQRQIIFLANSGDIKQARDLARAAMEKAPTDPRWETAYAFMQIPSDPAAARVLFHRQSRYNTQINILNALNIASCFISEGNRASALETLAQLQKAVSPNVKFWLWDPEYLLQDQGGSSIHFYSSTEWIEQVKDLLKD